MKKSVNQNRIRRMIRGGYTNYAIQKKIHDPISVIKRIRAGKDVPYYIQKSGSNEKDMCTHCGAQKKGIGKRFLCDYCYQNAGNQIYPECGLRMI